MPSRDLNALTFARQLLPDCKLKRICAKLHGCGYQGWLSRRHGVLGATANPCIRRSGGPVGVQMKPALGKSAHEPRAARLAS